ncbi:MAG: hypothetical protein N3G22_00200 [Candidatus Micrarchaeota archaeon]|nr:hypothetical protein [Candidatus Micrarchaeota archaeon]
MSLLSEFASQQAGYELAIVAATISILIGGILYGVGLGFSARRLRIFGAEEIGQGIISAAMVGALATFTALLDTSVSALVPQSSLPSCPGVPNPQGSPYSFYECNLQAISTSFSNLSSQLSRSADIVGFASSLKVSVGVVSAQPFFALESASKQLSEASQKAAERSALSFFELEFAEAVRTSALVVFLPAGLLLRTFFATRRLGAAAMAIAISAYVIYPLIFLHTFTTSKTASAASQASEAAAQFNAQFASIPLMDLDETGAVRNAIYEMSEGDFGGKVQPLFPLSFRAIALSDADLIIYPLISLAISAVAALELYALLSSPVFLPYFDRI